MDYSGWIEAVCTLLEVPVTNASSATPSSDTFFNTIYPSAITYAEERIQRELDLINTLVTDNSGSTTANTRKFTLPADAGTFIVVQQGALIVNGVRQPPMLPVSREFLDFCYPAETAPTTPSYPTYWCPNDGVSILLGPAPDSAYSCEIVGTIRVPPLSASNTSNFLTVELADLYVAASMVFFSAYRMDFGAQSSDPTIATSWETQYTTLRDGATVEEARKKFRSIGNSSRQPYPTTGGVAN